LQWRLGRRNLPERGPFGNCYLTWEVDVFNVALMQSHEFIVGIAVAAIMLSALVASSLFRNIALALAAGAVVVLYLQGGVANLLVLSRTLETEFGSIPDFTSGMLVGVAIVVVLLFGFKRRAAS
jgi:hypothetical protein